MCEEELAFNVQIGRRIGELRKRRGLSQSKLADLVGIGQPQLFGYEVGAVRCPVFRLRLIASAVGVPVQALIPDNHNLL
jgi:transcriptional regulator with XRE-family HTH domain